MGYGVDFPLYQLGKAGILWGFTGYGFSEAWFRRVSTVSSGRSHPYVVHITELSGKRRVISRHIPNTTKLINKH
ncbi:hypothetical protein C8Q79DRAFT_903077 [Trametes meyenii]|nr:hypothetical protein C8Q79DRAFT_903077 [Trametes meyenii]